MFHSITAEGKKGISKKFLFYFKLRNVISILCITFTHGNGNNVKNRGGSRAAATSKMERFVIIVNGWKLLTIITNRSILDVAAALDPPLETLYYFSLPELHSVQLTIGISSEGSVFENTFFKLRKNSGNWK